MFSRAVYVALGIALVSAPAHAQASPPTFSPKFQPKLARLAAPQGVTVVTASGGLKVSWKAATGAAGYQIMRTAKGSQTAVTVASVSATTLSYVDKGATTAASYQVVAVSSDQRKVFSVAVAYEPPAEERAAVKPPLPPAER